MKRGFRWWALCLTHNCIAHPLLPVGEVLTGLGLPGAADYIWKFHDRTVPEGDEGGA